MRPRILLFITLLLVFNGLLNAQEKGGCDLCGPTGASQNQANGNYSAAIGMNNIVNGANSLAVGQANKTIGAASVAIGKFAWANATNAVVIGSGTGNTEAKALINNYAGTLMIGFNSRRPTLFVGTSNGGVSTGKVGIGNVTNPLAKLHMLADSNEDAGIFLEPSNKTSKMAYLQLYDNNHKIMVSKEGMSLASLNDGMSFNAQNIRMNGKVGINIDNTFSGDYDYSLAVNGGILANKVYVKEVTEWHDYVFADDYKLMQLCELEKYIQTHGHLPDLPSENEILDKGYDVVEMEGVLLKKIEELTLYAIDLQRQLLLQQDILDKLR